MVCDLLFYSDGVITITSRHTPTHNSQKGGAAAARLLAKDAVFISPHKFPGGPGTPGILVVKKSLLRNHVPHVPGGGTVFYVSRNGHRYLGNTEEREEGGTPDVLGVIRAGLVFQLKASIGATEIRRREKEMLAEVQSKLASNRCIRLLGDASAERLPIIAMMVEYEESGRFLHWNFVTTLLSDLFGIQARVRRERNLVFSRTNVRGWFFGCCIPPPHYSLSHAGGRSMPRIGIGATHLFSFSCWRTMHASYQCRCKSEASCRNDLC